MVLSIAVPLAIAVVTAAVTWRLRRRPAPAGLDVTSALTQDAEIMQAAYDYRPRP